MIRYIIIALALLSVITVNAQVQYSKQLQDSIDVLRGEYDKLFNSESISIFNDTLLINQESNGVAGDYTKIPLLNVSCSYENKMIVLTCKSDIDTIPKCIVREIIYMNDRGSGFDHMESYIIRLWPGEEAKSLERIAGTMKYVVNAVQKK